MFSRCLKNQPVFTEEGDGDSVLARSFLRDQNIKNMLTVSNENSIWISSENTAGSLKDGSTFDNKSAESVRYKNALTKRCFFSNFSTQRSYSVITASGTSFHSFVINPK